MELARLFDELKGAAEKAGIAVRSEAFESGVDRRRVRGGLCTLRGKRVILVDAQASLPDRIATLASALAGVDLEGMFLPPIVRATIGAHHRASERLDDRIPGAAKKSPEVVAAGRRVDPGLRPLARARKRTEG